MLEKLSLYQISGLQKRDEYNIYLLSKLITVAFSNNYAKPTRMIFKCCFSCVFVNMWTFACTESVQYYIIKIDFMCQNDIIFTEFSHLLGINFLVSVSWWVFSKIVFNIHTNASVVFFQLNTREWSLLFCSCHKSWEI